MSLDVGQPSVVMCNTCCGLYIFGLGKFNMYLVIRKIDINMMYVYKVYIVFIIYIKIQRKGQMSLSSPPPLYQDSPLSSCETDP